MTRTETHASRRYELTKRWSRWIAALAIVLSTMLLATQGARAETRSLKVFFIHTNEKAEIVFKRNGRYDQAGLKKLNQFLRDWRRNEPTRMDPRLFDLIWEVYRNVGARDYIHVVCGYRSPGTNSMLRSRSKGVAEKSQHILGKAMDFYIPGVSLKKLRETGMKMQVGGVGYYPRSGSPFVHMDVGNVRHWPKMSRSELIALFPNGNTLHVPSDGKPLPGFQQALASYEARKKNGASAIAMASGGKSQKPATSLLAAFFGGGADDEEDSSESDVSAAPVKAAPVKAATPKPVAIAAAPVAGKPLIAANAAAKPVIEIIPPDQANRTDVPMIAESPEPVAETPEQIIAALPARSIPLPALAPRPQADVGPAPMATASIPPPADPVPDQIPFGMAQEPPTELRGDTPVETQAADAGVPLPTWRPQAPAELVASNEAAAAPDDSLLMALASADADPASVVDQQVAAVPTARPTAEDEAFPIASLPDTAPTPSLAPIAELGADQQAAVAAEIKANGLRVAALNSVNAASPKLAIAQRAPGTDPAAAIGAVKTTRKSGRANPADGRRIARSLAVPAEPTAARWVLTKDYVTKVSGATKAPSFAYNTVVSAPREVYTAGFQKGDQVADANRFTGKAVKFLSVARFE